MKIDVWGLIEAFLFIFCIISFITNLQLFYQRIQTNDFDVLIESNEFQNRRFGDFKNIQTIKTLKSFNDQYYMTDGHTIDFVGCCLERQTLVTHLFEQKKIDNPYQVLEINDVFLTGECDVFVNDTLYQFCRLFYNNMEIIQFPAGEVSYIDYALHVYMPSPFQIGTFLSQTLAAISLYPRDIIKKSTIILCEANQFVLDSLASFGIYEDHIHVKEHIEEIYYVHNLYSVLPHQCNELNPTAFSTMRAHFVKLFNLDSKPPSKYVLITLKNKPNELTNYESVLAEFSSKYPQIEWVVDNEPENFSSLIPFYNDIKLFFSCTSNNSVLTFMMQPNTVFCEIQGNFFDPLALHVSAYLGHHHILARIPGMMLDNNEDPYELPLTTALEMLKLALNYLNQSTTTDQSINQQQQQKKT